MRYLYPCRVCAKKASPVELVKTENCVVKHATVNATVSLKVSETDENVTGTVSFDEWRQISIIQGKWKLRNEATTCQMSSRRDVV